MKYEVLFLDRKTKVESAVDYIATDSIINDYNTDDYFDDCNNNATEEFNKWMLDLLEKGSIRIAPIKYYAIYKITNTGDERLEYITSEKKEAYSAKESFERRMWDYEKKRTKIQLRYYENENDYTIIED